MFYRRFLFAALFAMLVLSGLSLAASAQGPDGADVVARVYFENKTQLNAFAARLDIWEVNADEGYFVARLHPADLRALRAEGVRFEVDPLLTEQLYLPSQTLPGQTAGIPGYPCYRTVEETYSDLAALAAAHPNLATWTDEGDSWEKVMPGGAAGYDINALVLTNHNTPGPKPKFFLISAIHAREYTTAELATRFAEKLVNEYGVDPDITWLLDNYEFHLMPQVNPDGRKRAEAGYYWRKNTDNDDGCGGSSFGTDLNRNSSFKWNMSGASGDPCSEVYHGPSAASEPEVQTIEAYARSIFPDQRGPGDGDPAPTDAEGVFITLHSYSELVLFPWSWTDTQDAPNKTALQTLGRKFGYFNQYEVCSDCLYNAAGTTDDFTYGDLGVASYTFELGTAFFQSCSVFENDIIPKNMPALLYAFKSARRPYMTPSGPDALNLSISSLGAEPILTATVDDTRYDSGGWGVEPVQNIQAARYTIDTPSWKGGVPHAMVAIDGAFDSTAEGVRASIASAGLSNGRHIIFVEGQDADDNWGPPTAIFLTVNNSCNMAQAPSDLSEDVANGTDLHLSWVHDPANVLYQVWRSADPYFTPGDSGSELQATLQAADAVFEYTDAGAVGDVGAQRYYVLRAGNACSEYAPTLLRGGEFDFPLLPGS